MRGSTRPAVAFGLAVVVGVLVAGRLAHPCLPGLMLLLGLALALGRRGAFLACLALGALLPVARSPSGPNPPPDGRHPVALVGRPLHRWTRLRGAWWIPMQVTTCRQAGHVRAWHAVVSVYAAGSARPRFGVAMRVRGYLRRSAGYANQPALPPGPWRLSLKSLRFLQTTTTATDGRLDGWRRILRARIESALVGTEPAARQLVRVFALGDRRAVDTATVQGLRRLGLGHLLAVSGLHVGLIALLGLALPLPLRLRQLIALLGVVVYLWIVGPRPSLIRAVVMAWLAGGALLLGRLPAGLNALACAAVAMVVLDPAVVGDTGFQLSVAATGGIILFAMPLAARWTRLPRRVALPLAVTVAAQLAALPWSVAHFHYIPLMAPLANLVAVPWMGIVLALCFVFAAVAVVAPGAERCVTPILSLAARPVAWPAAMPAGLAPILPVAWTATGTAIIAAVALACLWSARPRGFGMLSVGLLLACCAPLLSGRGLELTVWDVGQGESVLLRDGPHTALIDGGGWRHGDFGGRVLLPALAGAGVHRIDVMIMSHADRDHCGGLVDLARYLPVGRLYAARQRPGEPCWNTLRHVPGVRPRVLAVGDTLRVGRWRVKALGPAERRLTGNDRSLVLRVAAGPWRALLPGDVEAAGEAALVRRWPRAELAANLLVVPHHGSRSSSTAPFLDAVHPALAVVSAGWRNAYGHPAAIVLSRLRRHGMRLLRTDRDGMVRVVPRPSPPRIELPATPRARP